MSPNMRLRRSASSSDAKGGSTSGAGPADSSGLSSSALLPPPPAAPVGCGGVGGGGVGGAPLPPSSSLPSPSLPLASSVVAVTLAVLFRRDSQRSLSASTPPSMSVYSFAMSFSFFDSLATRFLSSSFSCSVDRWATSRKVPEAPAPSANLVRPLTLTGCGGVGASVLRAANAGGARIITPATPTANAVPSLSRLRLRMLRGVLVASAGPGCSSARMMSAGRRIETTE
mmetsp:Transcript_7374/g.14761  ORF Transcript_7374/g.14761 Transcript_7374/m.14761 type:complete len:228 (-) Transcript_7374:85-768(-)